MTEHVTSPPVTADPAGAAGQAVVLLDRGVFAPFLDDALSQYRRAWETSETVAPGGQPYLPRCWALLLGRHVGDAMRVERLHFAANVRETDATVLEEFREVIVPCFGAGYTHKRRGYWCDPAELLRVTRQAEASGLEVLGSVHMHADMHRFWPSHARGLRLSEHPTPMDEYLFRQTGWPLNLICHLEGWEGEVAHAFGAWEPAAFGDEQGRATALPIRYVMDPLTTGPPA